MVDVEPTSMDCNQAIAWYISLYGDQKKKPNPSEVKTLRKFEVLRDALLQEEAFYQVK